MSQEMQMENKESARESRVQKYRRWPRKQRVKTPTILQMEAVECGAAALAIVLASHGCYVPLEELRVQCGVSRDGSKASNVLRAARTYGLTARGFRYGPGALRGLPLPMIVHWNFNHFLVVEGFSKDKVFLNDPATGPRVVSTEEFDQAFTGVVLTFEKSEQFKKESKQGSLFTALYKRLRGSETALLYIVLVSLLLLIPGILIPAFSAFFVDYYLVQGMESWVGPLLIGMGVTAVLRGILTAVQQHYLLRLESRLSLLNSSRLLWHILRLPIEFFTQRSAGDISSRVGINDRVAQLLSGQLATSLLNLVLIAFYALVMFRYSILLTLVGIGMAALNFVVLRAAARRRTDANQRLVMENSKLLATAFSGLQNIETIKATGGESDFFARWAGYQAKVFNATQELGQTTQIVTAVPLFLTTLTSVVILTIGGLQIINGQLSLGVLVAFQSLMISFLTPVNEMVGLGAQLQEMEASLNKLDDVLDYQPDPQVQVVDSTVHLEKSPTKLSGTIELRHITFGYSKLAKPLIEDFDLYLEPGTRVALVGGSGSGKSTVARLVAGLYQPWEGQILFDGQTRADIPRIILNNSLSIVDQDIFLFAGSVKENLTMWDSFIPEESVIQAAKDAHIHDDIANQPDGYNRLVSEGGRNFSGGQRQRLEIARALVTNPSILVLDEATSALDPVTEKIVDNNLRRRGCTCLIIAHRLSTIRDCDEIIVLDKGLVVERGTHEQLWRKGGHYARLIQSDTPKSERLLDSIWESITA